MKSGMLAAETIFDALVADDYSADAMLRYSQKVKSSWIEKELYEVRNFHQGFENGRLAGVMTTGISFMTRGVFPQRLPVHAGHLRMKTLTEYYGRTDVKKYDLKFDGKLTFDKVTDVYHSGASHDEDQPCHLKVVDTTICTDRCTTEFGNPCERFCPAAVYEMVGVAEERRLQINFSNCVHCKTCDILDPYQIINWTPPEGGGGPNYKRM
jgi:electron-transferring-flavoprotein dehydrogenase